MSISPCPVPFPGIWREREGGQGIEHHSRSQRVVHTDHWDVVNGNPEWCHASEVVMVAVLLPARPNAEALSAGFHETLLRPEILVVDRLEV